MTAIVVGLAAQQTFGNLFAGVVLLSARPFRVGDRIRLQAGALGGVVEGIVIDSGLLYTSLGRGAGPDPCPQQRCAELGCGSGSRTWGCRPSSSRAARCHADRDPVAPRRRSHDTRALRARCSTRGSRRTRNHRARQRRAGTWGGRTAVGQ
ncbi:MAG TPA: mechanosensitive ion channel family protein [Acidimicrobiia bacterium]|nr:mechanosensitive ion channel family protein [Acidimicrobiia bacterium]